MCKSFAPRSRQITTPAPVFTGRMPFLMTNQQRQSTEGSKKKKRLQMYYLVQWWRKGLLQIGQHLLKQEGLRKHLFVFIKGNKLLFFFARWNNS